MSFEVIFYETENGHQPAREFIDSLDVHMQAKIVKAIKLLEERGNALREPYSKSLTDGIMELRVQFGSNISRVLYFFYYDGQIVLTHGFVKKTQKTPATEIERAQRYRADYLKRNGESRQ